MTNTFPPTPELERITYYPNYPVGPRGDLSSMIILKDIEIKSRCAESLAPLARQARASGENLNYIALAPQTRPIKY